MADQQQIIDELIDYIDKAVLKHSVSNRHVAEVLYWLNEGLKKVSTDGLKDIFISKKQIDETNFLLRLLGGVEFSSGDDPYRITQKGEAFLKKLTLNGGLIEYDPTERVWKLNGNMLISGNITFGWDNGTYTAPTLLDLLPYDPATLSKEGGRLSVIGSAGSSFDESSMWTALLKSGSQQIDKSHLDTALAGYATENFVHTNLNALKGTGLPTTEGYRNVTEIANTLLTFLTGSDTDSTINKWKELEAFLAGFSETDTLATALSV